MDQLIADRLRDNLQRLKLGKIVEVLDTIAHGADQ